MLTDDERARLRRGAATWQLGLVETDLDRFERFATLLDAGNQRFNLTRIRPQDFVTLHFLDSLTFAAIVRPRAGTRLVDVGTGAGFPGIPLAIAFPEMAVTLVDSTRKRIRFLDDVIKELGLENARTVHARAEDLARDAQHRARYDMVTARAVASLPILAEWLLPLAKPDGLVIAFKSRDAGAEIETARARVDNLAGTIERVSDVALPETEIVRKLVLIRKRHETTVQQPRKGVR